MGTIRITRGQAETLQMACKHCGLTISDVLRRVARSLVLRPMCYNQQNAECSTNDSLDVMVHFRGEVPQSASMEQFRARLVEKCEQALRARKYPVFSTDKVEGRDFVEVEAK